MICERNKSIDLGVLVLAAHKRIIEITGVKRTIRDWSVLAGVSESTFRKRLSLGWSSDRLLSPRVSPSWTGKNAAGHRWHKDYLGDFCDG